MELKVYNTLTRRKEVFEPLQQGKVTFYVCGPTVYDCIHLGNARVFIAFDMIRRYLEQCGYEVVYVQNFTDIEDKMINRAAEMGLTVAELADRYIQEYFRDAAALKIRKASYHPRATQHMEQMVKIIRVLLEQGLAYESSGDVYFNTEAFSAYGALSQQKKEELIAGSRVEVDENKRSPLDFVLWKKEKPGEPSWESPWGKGRPGWHIECSAMAMSYLGETVDIHAGGPDLIFPHHENEIAQSEGCTGKPFVRYWMHTGYLNINAEKMSKSLGNVLTVRELVEQFHPLDLRFFVLSSHYRSPLNFNRELMVAACSGRKRLQTAVENLRSALETAETWSGGEAEDRLQDYINKCRAGFDRAMHDDFNSAEAIGVMFNLVKELNRYLGQPRLHRETLEAVWDFFNRCNLVLEVLEIPEADDKSDLEQEVNEAIQKREEARQVKDFATADRIRDELKSKGIILEDTPHGIRWRRE